MYRLRFEKAEQVFDIPKGVQVVLPLSEICKSDIVSKENMIIGELPSVIWEHGIPRVKEMVDIAKSKGIEDFLCENIGAINICCEKNVKMHGGFYLNVLNSVAAKSYFDFGLSDITLSFEMPFAKIRKLAEGVDENKLGMAVYGYLPLMKFRACPGMGQNGCSGCNRDKVLKDRKNEEFRILCHSSEYSELLNCVPLYAADKAFPKLGFYTLYYTVESRKECEKIFNMVCAKQEPDFRRTAGLYNRELL